MTTKRELNAKAHQQAILIVAAQLFKKDGVQAASITTIAVSYTHLTLPTKA